MNQTAGAMPILWGKLSASSVALLFVGPSQAKRSSSRGQRPSMSFAFRELQDRNCRVVQRPFGEGIREQGGVRPCDLAAFVLVLSFLLIQGVATAQVRAIRRILILNEVNPSYPAIPIISQGIETALSNSPYHLEFYSEYLDTGLFPDPAVQQEFRDFYIRKYRNRQPDVIITVGPSPLRFMQEVHKSAFPGVPIVFCLPIGDAPSAPALGPACKVESDLEAAETLWVVLRLQRKRSTWWFWGAYRIGTNMSKPASTSKPKESQTISKSLGRKSRSSGRTSCRFDSVAKHSEFPDHCCRMALLGLFRHCRAAFFIANAVMQNYPDQVTEAMRNDADCFVMSQVRHWTTVHDLEDAPLAFDSSIPRRV